MPKPTYIHGTEAPEQERLVELNRLTNTAFVQFLAVAAGTRVLEVGSGLGILASRVAAEVERVQVVGVELSAAQLAVTERSASVAYVQGDAHALPFRDRSFDLVYARYVLEHVAHPARALSEMHRVLRPSGRVAVLENDVSLLRLDPPCPQFGQVWASFVELQQQLGGDGLIGRRLFALLHAAGFQRIELSVQPELHWFGSPGWKAWVTNIIGNVESARHALIDRGYCTKTAVDEAVEELRALAERPDGSSVFVWNRAAALKM